MAALVEVLSKKVSGGIQKVYKHMSDALQCNMMFSVYLPPAALNPTESTKLPILYWLAGRGCSTDDFIHGTNFQRYASQHNMVVVSPDTSPRGVYAFENDDPYGYVGTGASYYLNASHDSRWFKHYQIFTYVTEELPSLVSKNWPIADCSRMGIFGHSMGGHGALIAALKRPDLYKSVSALAPVANIVNCGRTNMLQQLLGNDHNQWLEWDASELARKYSSDRELDILVDQGTYDPLLDVLLPHKFAEAVAENQSSKLKCNLRMQAGYDHSYDFITAFIADHFDHHARILSKS